MTETTVSTPTVSGYFDPATDEFIPAAPGSHEFWQVLSADQHADTATGYPIFEVHSDDGYLVGYYVGGTGPTREAAIEALYEAWKDLA